MVLIGDIPKKRIVTTKYLVERYDDNVVIEYKQFDTLQDVYDWCSDLYDDLINDYKIELGKLARIYKCVENVDVEIDKEYSYQLEFTKEE